MSFTKHHTQVLRTVLALFSAISASCFLSSCQDEDFGFTKDDVRAAVYDRNFIAKYGEIDPDQSWDLSSYAPMSSAATRAAMTRSAGTSCSLESNSSWFDNYLSVENSWYYVDPTLVSKFTSQLEEGKDNSSKGGPFTLTSNGTFYIIPMFQGASGIESDLHMVVTTSDGTYDKCIWTKSENIQKQVAGSFGWEGLTQKMDFWADYGNKGENGVYKGSTLYAKGVRTMPIKCEIPKDASVEFYLHVTRGHMNYRSSLGNEWDRWSANGKNENETWSYDEPNLAFTGVKQWSSNSHGTNSKMIALSSSEFSVDEETRKKYGENVMLIGCEDALSGKEDAVVWTSNSNSTTYNYNASYTRGKDNVSHPIMKINETKNSNGEVINSETVYWEGDNDMNDIIFMIVSDALPDVKRTDEISKRYLIEDLGSIVDWDFNDVVVDLVQTTKIEDGTTTVSQKAILKHLCGTTPFELYIGDAGNVSSSVKLNFTASTTIKDYKGQNQSLVMPNASGLIPGIQMGRDEELNIEFSLPTNKWEPDNNNIWVRVHQNRDYADRVDPNGGANFGGTLENNPGNSSGVINGEINSEFVYKNFTDVAFPRQGKVPRIIAVDTDFKWTAEDTDIQSALWTNVTITATPNNASMGSVSGAGTYRIGKEVVLSAIAKSNEYEFVQWSDGNKEKTRTFTATVDMTLTATFQHIQVVESVNTPNKTDDNGVMSQYAGVSAGSAEEVAKLIDAGYNTVTIFAEGVASGSEFRIVDANWSDLTAGDPLTYSMSYNSKTTNDGKKTVTFVLSDEQLAAIKRAGGILMQKFSRDNLDVKKVEWSKTPNYYTINLSVNIDGASDNNTYNNGGIRGRVTTDDRKTWNKCAAFGKACYPEGQTVTFTAQPDADHYFSHWENTKGGSNVVKANPITIQASSDLVAYFKTKPTLTLALDDDNKDDFNLYINGNPGTSAKIAPGETVRVKAKKKEAKSNSDFKFMWTGVSNIKDSDNDVEVSFVMPESETTVTATPLYAVQPQTCLFDDNSTASGDFRYLSNWNWGQAHNGETFDAGSVTVSCNGRTSKNTEAIFVPLEAQVKGSAISKPGYAFVKWLWNKGSDPNSVTITQDGNKTINYSPQAGYKKAKDSWKSISVVYNNTDAQSYNLNKPKTDNNAIGIKFSSTNISQVNVFIGSWTAIKSYTNIQNGYVVVYLTDAEVTSISESNKLFIQILGKNNVSLPDVKITDLYEFQIKD